MLEAFEHALEAAEGGEAGWETLEPFLDFFRLYVGGCHHGKEEDLLFPVLLDTDVYPAEGPLQVMLEEHRRGRDLVEAMKRELPGARAGDLPSSTRLARAAHEYADLIRAHIGKENPAVFDTADGLLAAPVCRRLCEAMRSMDARDRFDGKTVAELEALADRLVDGLP